jgi:hypothetical protein
MSLKIIINTRINNMIEAIKKMFSEIKRAIKLNRRTIKEKK